MTGFDGSEMDDTADGAPGFVGPLDEPTSRGPYVIRILGSNQHGAPSVPTFLESFDIEAHDGRGTADATGDVEKAYQFATAGAALEAWRAVPESRPTRDDGRPNRPLSAFTIEVLTIDQARQETTE